MPTKTSRLPEQRSMQASSAITQKASSNLALAFVCLGNKKRMAMTALYAFCREVDDAADDEAVETRLRRAKLGEWREDIRRACDGGAPRFAVNRELQPVIQEFSLPFKLFDELIQGCEMDLVSNSFATDDDLDLYCYRVASVVGLLSIRIFGFKNPACEDYAVNLGKALQCANILRDIGNDANRGRIYLPQSWLNRFDVTAEEILARRDSDKFRRLTAEWGTATALRFQKAARLLPAEDRRSMVAAEAMGAVYWRLMHELRSEPARTLQLEPHKLARGVKLWLLFKTTLKIHLGFSTPNYG